MQQYQVPQYINIEDKIIGPFTLKQFLYLLGGGAVAVIAWMLFNTFLFVVVAAPVAGFAVALAFLKINGRPFATVVANGIAFYLKPRLYIWKRAPAKKTPLTAAPATPAQLRTPSLTKSKLSDLSWSLDIKEKMDR